MTAANIVSSPLPSSAAPLPLAGRVALVTGGSRGIGREISSQLAALGARVVINYASNSGKADELVEELASRGHQSVAFREAFGSPPHIVVACAGIMDPKYPALADTAVEDFDATFAVNTRGKFLVCREAARRIPPHSGGRIVALSSTTVAVLLPGYGAYTASNAAVEAMTRILAKEMFFAGKDEAFVRKVEERSMGRLAETTEVASVVTFLVSDAAAWVNGQVIRVNGGFA
nr:unnamed protein product [Digitaria exilis]